MPGVADVTVTVSALVIGILHHSPSNQRYYPSKQLLKKSSPEASPKTRALLLPF